MVWSRAAWGAGTAGGDAIAFLAGWMSFLSTAVDAALYPSMFVSYLDAGFSLGMSDETQLWVQLRSWSAALRRAVLSLAGCRGRRSRSVSSSCSRLRTWGVLLPRSPCARGEIADADRATRTVAGAAAVGDSSVVMIVILLGPFVAFIFAAFGGTLRHLLLFDARQQRKAHASLTCDGCVPALNSFVSCTLATRCPRLI